jgi:hypothetical protein
VLARQHAAVKTKADYRGDWRRLKEDRGQGATAGSARRFGRDMPLSYS